MIRGFSDRPTEKLFRDGICPGRWRAIEPIVVRKLDMIDAATCLSDLRSPPGNRLEALRGDRASQYAIRINKQWRICFVWSPDGPDAVEIVDYH